MIIRRQRLYKQPVGCRIEYELILQKRRCRIRCEKPLARDFHAIDNQPKRRPKLPDLFGVNLFSLIEKKERILSRVEFIDEVRVIQPAREDLHTPTAQLP